MVITAWSIIQMINGGLSMTNVNIHYFWGNLSCAIICLHFVLVKKFRGSLLFLSPPTWRALSRSLGLFGWLRRSATHLVISQIWFMTLFNHIFSVILVCGWKGGDGGRRDIHWCSSQSLVESCTIGSFGFTIANNHGHTWVLECVDGTLAALDK